MLRWLSEEFELDEESVRKMLALAVPMAVFFWGLLVLVLVALGPAQ